MSTMVKVLAVVSSTLPVVEAEKVLVVLPYSSTGVNGSWELPRAFIPGEGAPAKGEVGAIAEDVVQAAVGLELDGDVFIVGRSTSPDGSKESFNLGLRVAEAVEGDFHCSMDVTDKRYPEMLFPAYVQYQWVSPEKALRMLKKSYASVVASTLEMPKA